MKKQMAFHLVSVICALCMFFLCLHERIEANDKGESAQSAEILQKTERQEFLENLCSTTRMEAEENQAFGRFDDAINLIEKNMRQLEKTDYEEYPDLVAQLCEILAGAYFRAAGSKVGKDEKISNSKIALGYVDNSIEWTKKAVQLNEKSGRFLYASLGSVSLGCYHQIVGDTTAAEEDYKKAITIAESAPLECEDRARALFHAKEYLMLFYKDVGRIEEARGIARELELMIENKQMTGVTKQDIRSLLEPSARRGE